MQSIGAQRLYAMLHEDAQYHDGWFTSWAKEPSETHPYRYDDGVSIGVDPVDLYPDDDFLEQSVPAEQPDGEIAEAAE